MSWIRDKLRPSAHPKESSSSEMEPCPVCGGISFLPVTSLRDNRTGSFKEPFDVARCVGCRLVALRPAPAADALARGYQDGYGPYPTDTAGGGERSSPTATSAIWKRRLRRAWHALDGSVTIDRIPLRGRVLDVGAGQGSDVAFLHSLGLDAIGLEPNLRAVEVCRMKGLPVIEGTLESADFEPGSFDVVILNQVLEHLPDPHSTLMIVRRLLRPGGSVAIFTPNVTGLPARAFGDDWAHWHVPYHLYLYGPAQLRKLLGDAGFEARVPRTLTPAFWLNMSLQARRLRSQRNGQTLPQRNWQPHPLVRIAIAPFFRAIDLAGQGDCLFVLGTKR